MVDRVGVTVKLSLLQQLKGVKDRNCSRGGGLAGVIPASNRNFSRTPGIPRASVYHSVQNFSASKIWTWCLIGWFCFSRAQNRGFHVL